MSLIALSLTLEAPATVVLPHDTGRAVYAAALAAIAGVDGALADAIHAADGPTPLTCSRLIGARSGPQGLMVQAGQSLKARITGLTPPVADALAAAFLASPPPAWTLLEQPFTVQAVTCDPAADPWTGRSTYETLASTGLLAGPAPRPAVTLQFAGPTAFKSKGIHMPVPLPELLFGSLVDRWNAFSPVTVSPDMRRFAAELIAISRYRLTSRAVQQKAGGVRMGGVGEVTYRALGGDRYWWRVMHMLADFACYGGAGIQTTTGMGQCRRMR